MPASCSDVSFVKPPLATVPMTGTVSSVTLVIAGVDGATVSMVTVCAGEAELVLPAASMARALKTYVAPLTRPEAS